MNTDMNQFPEAIMPIYRTSSPNEPISLYSGDIEADFDGDILCVQGEAVFEWLPRPGVRLLLRPESNAWTFHAFDMSDMNVHLVGIGIRAQASFESGTISTEKPTEIRYTLKPAEFRGSRKCKRFMIHIANLEDYLGRPVKYGNNRVSAGRLEFHSDPWQIIVDEIPECRELVRELKSQGGYGLTHVVSIQRSDGGSFDADDAIDVQHALWRFLTFCNGRFIGIPLTIAFDGGERVYERWISPVVTGWESAFCWAPCLPATPIEPLFKQFYRLWKDEFWKDTLITCIHWYLVANLNSAMLEGSIAMSQIALERLAWAIMVQKDRVLGQDGFTRLASEDNLRLLLDRSRIPSEIPAFLSGLTAYAKANNCKDIPESIVRIRNRIVHPLKGEIDKEALIDAWRASVWCLEMVLLKLLDYRGEYDNRMADPNNLSETVPWAIEHGD